jgi:hypothetical protein
VPVKPAGLDYQACHETMARRLTLSADHP